MISSKKVLNIAGPALPSNTFGADSMECKSYMQSTSGIFLGISNCKWAQCSSFVCVLAFLQYHMSNFMQECLETNTCKVYMYEFLVAADQAGNFTRNDFGS